MSISFSAIAQSTEWWSNKQINVKTIAVNDRYYTLPVAISGCPSETDYACRGYANSRWQSSSKPTCRTSCTAIYWRSTWSHARCISTKAHPFWCRIKRLITSACSNSIGGKTSYICVECVIRTLTGQVSSGYKKKTRVLIQYISKRLTSSHCGCSRS